MYKKVAHIILPAGSPRRKQSDEPPTRGFLADRVLLPAGRLLPLAATPVSDWPTLSPEQRTSPLRQ